MVEQCRGALVESIYHHLLCAVPHVAPHAVRFRSDADQAVYQSHIGVAPAVEPANSRQLFSVVFSDFYLFESLFGLDSLHLDANARNYLVQLQLNHKVKVEDGTLSTVELSQGQRKRLALLTAYLEDRPIYLFDEWAADQDPLFKEIFYHQLLPELKAKGKALIVISHDDRYYHLADNIIKLDSGKLQSGDLLSQESVVPPHWKKVSAVAR